MLDFVRRQLVFHIGRTLFVCVSIGSALAVILLLKEFQQGLLAQLRQTVMKGANSRNAAFFNSHRMMRRYATEAYIR